MPPEGIDHLMRSETRRRLIRRFSSVLLVIGGLLLAYPLWSGAYALVQQERIDRAYVEEVREFSAVVETESESLSTLRDPTLRVARLASAFADRIEPGDPVGRLQIPRIDLDTKVLEGVRRPPSLGRGNDQGLLRSAPVHYGLTPLPGQGRPFAVAGHRTTYGAPFIHLDRLEPGDRIIVTTPYARFRYRVAKTTTVEPDQVTVLYDRGYDLVLTTCHPPYSARQRLIVWAMQESFTLR